MNLAERLARHLRHNRGVMISITGTVIPPGWVPHPEVAHKLGTKGSYQDYGRALRAWRKDLRVGCLRKFNNLKVYSVV